MRRFFSITLLFVLLLFIQFSARQVKFGSGFALGCQKSEREALLKFKHSLSDPAKPLSSWEGDDCCHWIGVRCHNHTGRVQSLDLRNDDLYGWYFGRERMLSARELDSSLSELKELRYLDLSGNDFYGARVPGFIGSMKDLRYLNLSGAGFGGNIPPSLGNLTRLITLHLGDKYEIWPQIMTVQDFNWASRLGNLQSLDMSGIYLDNAQGSLKALSKLRRLSSLHLSLCFYGNNRYLSQAFYNFTWVSTLQHLDLSYNDFDGPLPHYMSNMSSLRSLTLAGNHFNGSIPLWFRNMKSLDYISLNDNSFDNVDGGTIMGIMGNPCKLRVLHLYSNGIEGEMGGLNDNFSRCIHYDLEVLDLRENRISGSLSPCLGNLTKLKYLDVGGNEFRGPIPETLGDMSSLTFLGLDNMVYEFVLSDVHLANLSSLRELYLSHTPLELNITPDWRPPFQLQYLDLSFCKIQGQFPIWIGTQHQLVWLDMSNNFLQGEISKYHLANLSSLFALHLDNNSLSLNFSHDWNPPFQLHYFSMGSCGIQGELPQWLETQINLTVLDLFNNTISGRMLDWSRNVNLEKLRLSHNHIVGPITRLPSKLQYLDISYNRLSGTLSPNISTSSGKVGTSLCQLTGLEYLNLQSNTISGTIPHDCWVKNDWITNINLSFNNLSGVIPEAIGLFWMLEFLNLNRNSLEGKIPTTFTASRWLIILDLGENKLSGHIPSFGDESLPVLRILRLRGNQLEGSIPLELCSLPQIQILDLSTNNLTGEIPPCLGHLKGMIKSADVKAPSIIADPTSIASALMIADPPSIASAPMIADPPSEYPEEVNITEVWEGEEREYTTTLKFLENLDLSCNALVGPIPDELAKLSALLGLNLSYNHLNGRIPDKIGEMKSLESLDLSNNNLSGVIPSTISNLNFLSHLNLSHNKLRGKIPTGQQLQTLNDPSIYADNLGLCGDPLPKCPWDKGHQGQEQEDKDEDEEEDPRENVLFYMVVGLGFIAGFWGVIATLWLNKQLRYALFQVVENVVYYFYV